MRWFVVALSCDVGPPSGRKDCGYGGIPEAKCRSRKCCWDNSIPNVKWCFYPAKPSGNTYSHLTDTIITVIYPHRALLPQ